MPLQVPHSEKDALKTAAKGQEISGLPSFVRKGGSIHPSDPSTFDFSVLGESFCSFFRGLDQLLVVLDLDRLHHRAFETLACYSAAYQFVDSILSIHGLHFVYKPLAPWKVATQKLRIDGKRQKVIAVKRRYFEIAFLLGRSNGSSWGFSATTASHEIRWALFGQFLIDMIDRKHSRDIPLEVRRMYGYLRLIDEFRRFRFQRKSFTDKIVSDGALKSAISKYGKDIGEIRHKAVYQNQSYDLLAYHALASNQDLNDFLQVRIESVKNFAYGLARWNAEIVSGIFQHLLAMKPGPRRLTDWLEVACTYIPLDIDLTQTRLQTISKTKEIVRIHPQIRGMVTDILASYQNLQIEGFKVFPKG